MSSEEHHVALPKLYGAPAYARPPRPVDTIERPFDPDDLPLEVARTPEEQELATRIVGNPWAPMLAPAGANGHPHDGALEGRPFRLRGLTAKLFKGN